MFHVSRSADLLRRYLPALGMTYEVGVACRIVHFTGYELDLDDIEFDHDRADRSPHGRSRGNAGGREITQPSGTPQRDPSPSKLPSKARSP